jgi:glycogen operon protein
MILGGDEIGRTQGGNNNAYAQDNELSWYDWSNVDEHLLAFTKTALALRRDSPALRPPWYLRTDEGLLQMALYAADGSEMAEHDWQNAPTNTLAVALNGRLIEDLDGETSPDRFLLLLNAHHEDIEFAVPWGSARWQTVLTSGEPDESPSGATETVRVQARSFLLLHST